MRGSLLDLQIKPLRVDSKAEELTHFVVTVDVDVVTVVVVTVVEVVVKVSGAYLRPGNARGIS